MNNDYKSPAFKKLLDSLQQQSWELELLISGFAIFGLFSAYEPLEIAIQKAQHQNDTFELVLYSIVLFSCIILLFNLVLHVVLRGLWIGALGLRYVSGDIDFEHLKYTDRFTDYLKKRIVSFDRYIGNLENYCSVLFAISFLLVFYLLAITCVNATFVLTMSAIIDNEFLPRWLELTLGIPVLLFFILGIVLTLIDFAAQGILKKNRVIAKLYFPFYWVFSFLTLSFLYRPLVYNFLDNKFGKRLILMLVPVYILLLFFGSFVKVKSNVMTPEISSSKHVTTYNSYLDMLTEEGHFPGKIAIQSKTVKDAHLQIFMPYTEDIEDNIFLQDTLLKPESDLRGYKSSIVVGWERADRERNPINLDNLHGRYLNALNAIYSFKIDQKDVDADFVFAKGVGKSDGFETFLALDSLKNGKHTFALIKKMKKNDSISIDTEMVIPFWYFKEE